VEVKQMFCSFSAMLPKRTAFGPKGQKVWCNVCMPCNDPQRGQLVSVSRQALQTLKDVSLDGENFENKRLALG
jgi:hypothetical protein